MNNRTLEAMTNQLRAMNCSSFKLGVYNRKNDYMKNYDVNFKDIINRISYLKAENVNGNDIYIRPSELINRALILVDDINVDCIKSMKKDGYNPACIIQTSPCNFQVWISLGLNPLMPEHRKLISRYLAEKYYADLGSVGSNHYGRLAGFTNRKPKYINDKGYPYVLCCESTGLHAVNKNQLIYYAKNFKKVESININAINKNSINTKQISSERAFDVYFEEWKNNIKLKNLSYDISRGDFAVVCRMIKDGYLRDDIIRALMKCSPDISSRKGKYVEDYAIRTLNAAEKFCT